MGPLGGLRLAQAGSAGFGTELQSLLHLFLCSFNRLLVGEQPPCSRSILLLSRAICEGELPPLSSCGGRALPLFSWGCRLGCPAPLLPLWGGSCREGPALSSGLGDKKTFRSGDPEELAD